MIKIMAVRAAKYLFGLTRRFLANQPANPYENIVFSGVRSVATQFGRAV